MQRLYETLLLLDPKQATRAWDETKEQVKQMFARVKAELLRVELWRERKMCYEIKGTRRGLYYLFHFSGEPEVVAELSREIEFSEYVIRGLVTRYGGTLADIQALPDTGLELQQPGGEMEEPEERGGERMDTDQESGDDHGRPGGRGDRRGEGYARGLDEDDEDRRPVVVGAQGNRRDEDGMGEEVDA